MAVTKIMEWIPSSSKYTQPIVQLVSEFIMFTYSTTFIENDILMSRFADKDECFLQTHNCSRLAFCNNTAGSYNCSCFPGYDGDGFNCTGELLTRFDL